MELLREDLLKIYQNCEISRYIDEQAQKIYWKIGKPVVFSGIGNEVAVSIISTRLSKNDYLIPRYRGFAAVLGKGISLKKVIGEICRKKTGATLGIGDISSFRDPEIGIPGYSTILGSSFGLSAGLAFAVKFNKENRIVVHFFGDGESSRSQFGSALNLASLLKLPLLLVCENNGISANIPLDRMSSTQKIAVRGEGYGLKNKSIGEHDIPELVKQIPEIIEYVRSGHPFLLEIMQKRFVSHFFGMGENSFVGENIPKNQDPLEIFKKFLFASGITDKELALLKEKALIRVDEIYKEVLADPVISEEEFLSIFHE